MSNHEVLSAFLDNEPFDPQTLTEALAEPAGRELLIDLLTLRRLSQPDGVLQAAGASDAHRFRPVRLVVAAALFLVALLGGYRLGERSSVEAGAPPAPTHIVQSDTTWQQVPSGGVR